MTTHLRARAVRAGAFLTLAGLTLAVTPAPASAAPPEVVIDSISSTNVESGSKITLRYTIINQNQARSDVNVNVIGMDCSGDCSPSVTLDIGRTSQFTATLTAGGVDPGDTEQVQVQVQASIGGESKTAQKDVTVRGPQKAQVVRQVSGRVKDDEGNAVSGAQVAIRDSAQHEYSTSTNGDGGYQFTSSDDKPIAPGTITVGALKDGFETATVRVQAGADKTVTVPLTIKVKAAAPTATPTTAEATPSETATEAATDEETPAAPAPTVAPDNAASEDGSSGNLLFILGGLLVAAGIGAIVLLVIRRKKNNEDDDPGLAAAPAPVAPSRYGAAPDATRIAPPLGAGPLGAGANRANDATMVTNMAGAGSLSDAPTMLQQAVPADEFPDPYGAPAVPLTGYTPGGQDAWSPPAGAAGVAGAAAAASTPYGRGAYVPTQGGGDYDTAYTAPVSAAPADQQRYDEPTGMYRAEPADQGGYGSYGAAAGGIDSGNAYGRAAGTYGAGRGPDQAGYDAPHRRDDDQPGAYGDQTSVYGGGAYRPEPAGGSFRPEAGDAYRPDQADGYRADDGGAFRPDSGGYRPGQGGTAAGGGYRAEDGAYRADQGGGPGGFRSDQSAFRSEQGGGGYRAESAAGSAGVYRPEPAGGFRGDPSGGATGSFRPEPTSGAPGGFRPEPTSGATGSFRPEPTGGAPGQRAGSGFPGGGYGDQGNAYGAAQAGGYGNAQRGGYGGDQGGGYGGDQGGGYGGDQGGFRGDPGGGYGTAQGGGYGSDQGGGFRGDQGGSPRGGQPGGTYGGGQGYGAGGDGYDRGGYGNAQDQAGRYGQQPPAPQQPGQQPPGQQYPAQQYPGQQPSGQQPGSNQHGGQPGQRRPLDWLDD